MAIKLQKPVLTGHTAGIFADMTLDGPEIGTLVAVVDRAKNLPNRKTMGKQDPYCAMRLGKEAKKTDTDRRGGQTPKWDQELRFTVHESPDYYKLKCSIFNDDKKTDLIGEAWIDLSDLIKPGGGSNDLWHQLNYKGKYAGDIRVELTYYDLRPREEKPEKKRREKVSTPVEDIVSPSSLPRQLGPRDVRRRPLPSSPAASSPAQTPPVTTPPVVTPREEPPQPPPKIPLPQSEKNQLPQEVRPRQEYGRVDHYIEEKPNTQLSIQHYRQPFCEEQSSYSDQQDEPTWNIPDHPTDYTYGGQQPSMDPSPAYISPMSWHNEPDEWIQHDHRMSQQYIAPAAEEYTSPRSLPNPPNYPMEPQYHLPSQNTSPTKPSRYRDSPLRQSMNHYEPAMHMVDEPESYDEPPPPPPIHRETTPRKSESQYPPSSFPQNDQAVVAFSARPTAVTSRRASVNDRSPLQHIEDEYELYTRNQARLSRNFDRQDSQDFDLTPNSRERQQSIDNHYHLERQHSYDVYDEHDPSPRAEQYGRNIQQFSEPKPVYQKPVYQDRSESFDEYPIAHRSSVYEEHQAVVPHSHSQPNLPQPDYYKPQPIRPRPATSTPQQTPQRKAVSPGSISRPDSKRLSSVPFGPDAYDVLNPASSPVTNDGTIFQDREQGKESARMREVQKLREQGPIIGNDGRVIDPSDHLPSDTWAPEPERKARKPEHVIHFRTKNDSRPRNAPTQSPTSTRIDHHRQSDSKTHSSPSGPSSSNKHRSQKSTPIRPLPTQPYPQPRSETRPEPQSRSRPVEDPSQKALQRYSYQEKSPVHRPHSSEYQVPSSNDYRPRGSSYQNDYARTPSKPHMQTGRDYNPRASDIYDSSLAAEMSMIDIGPRREGQMVLSNRRRY